MAAEKKRGGCAQRDIVGQHRFIIVLREIQVAHIVLIRRSCLGIMICNLSDRY